MLNLLHGDLSGAAPPFPISNKEVKRASADDTEVERPWDNMSLPQYQKNLLKGGFLFFYMDNLPKPTNVSSKLGTHVYQVIQKVESTTTQLFALTKEEGIDITELSRLLSALPLEDNEGITYLEAAGQCILETSSLIDTSFPELPYNQRLAKKYRLMARLLELKAGQVE